ncbi:GreA/GreB family elongation factor [Ectobacillus ponti]|uniref:GreA/GreB family elongation factor n=1 Tax=Ectobacillus ponti TaxID=2961894 RepID=A0AA41XDL0_9BACI|nr:GreA/GreB family elongation factor [Ectobacillus ponti]MCP8970943.1 GreA/GreB family elongation factor [Ectobacillus ponti]
MEVKVTPTGVRLIQQNIESLKSDLKYIREEKNIAYTLCGDTWHDNPHFNKLEQDEKLLNKRIQEVEKILASAVQVELDKRDTETVQLGSIVRCFCEYPDFEEEEIYEIVGYGESNLEENKLFYDSPVAKNLIGLSVGQEASFETPGGRTVYRIIEMYSDWEEAKSKQV